MQSDASHRNKTVDEPSTELHGATSSRARRITTRLLLAFAVVAAVYAFGYLTADERPMANGTLIVDADPVASTPTSCAVAPWVAGSLGPGLPLEVVASDGDQVGQGKFHDDDYSGDYYDESHTECAFNFGVAVFPVDGQGQFRLAYGDYQTGLFGRSELQDGILLEILPPAG